MWVLVVLRWALEGKATAAVDGYTPGKKQIKWVINNTTVLNLRHSVLLELYTGKLKQSSWRLVSVQLLSPLSTQPQFLY